MTKMAGVTQAKAWFRKNRVCSSLNFAVGIPCVAKLLQTDLNDIRMTYGVADTDFNCVGINYGYRRSYGYRLK